MTEKSVGAGCDFDKQHIWHPYQAMPSTIAPYFVDGAEGVYLNIGNNQGKITPCIDGMSSWWAAIHGYNHPVLNAAISKQVNVMSHVMFGGLTHQSAIDLAKQLIDLTPNGLTQVFFSDSGSVAVEVAIKMALQYWQAKKQTKKNKLVTITGGYHGDTFMAMSVCDPVQGMHHLFNQVLAQQYFVKSPALCDEQLAIDDLTNTLKKHHQNIAALILEPLVQGAGGMRFYSSSYLQAARHLCDQYHVLLIADEIATGFGRTGSLFACEQSVICPDILCLGKALTGGYLSLAATLTSEAVSRVIGVLMHGPTFMANPLACSVASASIALLLNSPWQRRVQAIETQLKTQLLPLIDMAMVKDVRVLGAIGVIEMKTALDVASVQKRLLSHGVWLRPFGCLLYTMPAFIITPTQLTTITTAMADVTAMIANPS